VGIGSFFIGAMNGKPPSDEGGGFLQSKKPEGERRRDYPSGAARQLP